MTDQRKETAVWGVYGLNLAENETRLWNYKTHIRLPYQLDNRDNEQCGMQFKAWADKYKIQEKIMILAQKPPFSYGVVMH